MSIEDGGNKEHEYTQTNIYEQCSDNFEGTKKKK